MRKEQELIKNTIILTVGKICTQFVSFLLLPLYTALLTPEEFGVVDLFNTYVALLVPLFNWQFENGMFRFMLDYRSDKKEIKKIFSTVLCANLLQIVIYLLFYCIAQNYISSPYKVFLAIDVSLNIILNSLLQFPRGIGDNTTYAVGSFISATTTVALNVVFIAGLHMGAFGMFEATILAKLITIVYLMFKSRIWKYFSFAYNDKSVFVQIFRYSFPLVPNQLCWWVIDASDRTIISYAIGIAANGIYSVANKFSSLFVTFYNIFHLSWTESVSLHIKDEDSKEFITDVINTILRLFISICFCIIAIMPFVFPLFIDEKYKNAYQQIPILIVAVLFQVVVGLYSVIYTALKKSIEIMKTSVYAAIINVVVDVILVKFIGIYAASISTLVAYMTMAIYRYFHVKRFLNIVIEKKLIIMGGFIGGVTLISYYMSTMSVHVLTAVVVGIASIILNRKFIYTTVKSLKNIKGLSKYRR